MNLASKLTILTYLNCYLLRLKLCANLIKAKEFSFLNLINFIVNTFRLFELFLCHPSHKIYFYYFLIYLLFLLLFIKYFYTCKCFLWRNKPTYLPTLKITQIDQHLHFYNSMIIYTDGLRQFGRVL